MKNKFKKLLVLLCVLTCAVSICGCGKEAEISYDEAKLINMSQTVIEHVITPLVVDDVQEIKSTYEPTEVEAEFNQLGLKIDGQGLFDAYDSWIKCSDEIGELTSVNSIAVTAADEEEITVTASVTCTTGKTAQVEMLYTPMYKLTSTVFNVDRTFGENMRNAGLNTLLGMGTVFVVLILISFIISLFKYIAVVEEKLKKKKEQPSAAAVAAENTVAQIVAKEELSDDTELVAVISAAIAAYEEAAGGSSDGYVVRSIKRRY